MMVTDNSNTTILVNDEEHRQGVVDEESRLLETSAISSHHASPTAELTLSTINVLLIGEFLSHAETTIMLVVATQIATQQGDSTMSNWLVAAYTLGSCSSQMLYGKLSDIFGRKYLLACGYVLMATGCLLSGLSSKLWQSIASRIISGLGGAGVMTMASVIITDTVPKSHIAQYRAYINMSTTLGRSLGGPVGGYILDYLGWRWVFWSRLPIFLLSLLFLTKSLTNYIPGQQLNKSPGEIDTKRSGDLKAKLKKIDGVGSLYLVMSITSLMIFINQLGLRSFGPPFIASSAILSITLPAFIFCQLYSASDPIFDLRILTKPNVAISYLVMFFQSIAQTALMFSVPLYFQITENASSTVSGLHLVPSVLGNTIGSLFAGLWIRYARRYKSILVAVGPIAAIAHSSMFLRWNGRISFAESLVIIPGGFSTGMAQSAVFVSMGVFLEHEAMAMATGGFFLVSSIGSALGVLASSSLTQVLLERYLRSNLVGPDAYKILKRVMEDYSSIYHLKGQTHDLVLKSFIQALKGSFLFGLSTSIIPSLLALLLHDAHL